MLNSWRGGFQRVNRCCIGWQARVIDPFLWLGRVSGFLRDVILCLGLLVFFPLVLSTVLSVLLSVVVVVVSFTYFRCRIGLVLSQM